MTLKQWLRDRYNDEQLGDIITDGVNYGGNLTMELYFEYHTCIWQAVIDCDKSLSHFSSHTDLARYLLSEAAKYYAQEILDD